MSEKCDYCEREAICHGGVIGIPGKESRYSCQSHLPLMSCQQDIDAGLERLRQFSVKFSEYKTPITGYYPYP